MTRCRRMMQKTPVARALVLAALLLAWPGYALANTCGNAVFQLTQYAAQVNQIANWEQSQGIPMKCVGNPMCVQVMLQQLKAWYAQQSNFVNMTYMQIAQACTNTRTRPDPIDLSNPEEITVDNEDRETVIKVPSTPEGFQPQ